VVVRNLGGDNLYWEAFSGTESGRDDKDTKIGGMEGFIVNYLPIIIETFPIYFIYIKIKQVSHIFGANPFDISVKSINK